MRCLVLFTILTLSHTASAQWTLQDAHTKASLRGIHSLGNGVAWASGTDGTVLRTEDGGIVWQLCKVPPGAAKLDFRGVQAFDNNTAIVMSSGKGDLSRLYKTTDGCQTWKKVFDDPDETGFFDSLRRVTGKQMYLLGDPVNGKFSMFYSQDAGSTWFIADDPGLDAPKDAGAFAASNSALINVGPFMMFGTGGPRAAVYAMRPKCDPAKPDACTAAWVAVQTSLAEGKPAAGVFSLAGRFTTSQSGKTSSIVVAVGGTYDKPDDATGTAAYSRDSGTTWTVAQTPPHGYRSAVVYDSSTATWIAVGPNGTGISTDDGRNWRALKPGPNDAPDADKNWNALSLPFVVGPNGRIGVLRPSALKP
ncbi:MAG: glycosyl hydrolase [Acidobacteriaceae bacterium]